MGSATIATKQAINSNGHRLDARRQQAALLNPTDHFVGRHLGPSPDEVKAMLEMLGLSSLDALVDSAVPRQIRMVGKLALPGPRSESDVLAEMRRMADNNRLYRSFIGMGYYGTITPPVILRNIMENPGWYTQYTPYQAEIAQGRLEALLNFQTTISDLTGMDIANASLLDEGTAAAEAMTLCKRAQKRSAAGNIFFVSEKCHPQTVEVVRTRAVPLGLDVLVGDHTTFEPTADIFGVLLQYPDTEGTIHDYAAFCEKVHAVDALVVAATDLLALTLLTPPGEWGADVAVGSAQRFGVPLGYGGPHAAFMATKDEYKRIMPGRLVGVSKDVQGNMALRLSLQTREQHIRRERATSNICTAQVLLAVMASMYAVYHGPDGLAHIARRVQLMTAILAGELRRMGYTVNAGPIFDTLKIGNGPAGQAELIEEAESREVNLRIYADGAVGVSLDEATTLDDLRTLLEIFGADGDADLSELAHAVELDYPAEFARTSDFLTHPVFNTYHSETEMLRYITKLQNRDLSLAHSMIPLGSCTMKLNATTEMIPVTWPEFNALHPFAPLAQAAGYRELFTALEDALKEVTGFAAVSLQPNAGSQGEYTGLLVIRAYHHSRGDDGRVVCLIPSSAHGTNPASAMMAGMEVVVVRCDDEGNIDVGDLRAKAEKHSERLAALMVTYPSTHGVFETAIREICEIVHAHGGQVYMDGANMNALVGLCRPGDFGADVCHLNLHKTFCLSEGTPVKLANGISRPIEDLLQGQAVYGWSSEEGGVRSARLEAVYPTGRKECVEVTLEDGRTITCTPDHRLLTTEGWVEAAHLDLARHRVIVGSEAPLDDPKADLTAERDFRAAYGPLELSMDSPMARERTLAFFRLFGALLSDGTYAQEIATGRRQMRLFFGTQPDARRALEDIECLTGLRPKISPCNQIFSVRLPAVLHRALAAVPGIGDPGPRIRSQRGLPDVIKDPGTPKAILREFLGALFGGDGCAPMVVHLQTNPNTMKEVRFVQTRVDREALVTFMEDVHTSLQRLGVEALIGNPYQLPGQHSGEEARWRCVLTVVWGTAFAERVGFRYCSHKSIRLAAATAWWRLKETVLAQKHEVARRAMQTVASIDGNNYGPQPVWGPAVSQAYEEFSAEQPVLNPYYTSFQGFARVSKQHLTNAIDGQMGTRLDIQNARRTHRRAVLPAQDRHGEDTGMPTLETFLTNIGARDWFNRHSLQGTSYKVQYATTSQDDPVEPTLTLGVVAVRPAGERKVYDLTVADLHSFMANGAVVHNCIPHGGGGPGMGPIGVAAHLAPFLPGHPVVEGVGGEEAIGPISSAPWSSASILPISYAYIAMMGGSGLTQATKIAILNANYIAARLDPHFPVLYKGKNGRVAHECIVDARDFKEAGIEVEDIAKRLMDYGFHAPTMSFPVAGTLMIEPTESESKDELDRFCDAMIAIREEIRAVERGEVSTEQSPLHNAPHTAGVVTADTWDRPYSREVAAFPAAWVKENKFWPYVARIDNVYGDRHLVCACPPIEVYED